MNEQIVKSLAFYVSYLNKVLGYDAQQIISHSADANSFIVNELNDNPIPRRWKENNWHEHFDLLPVDQIDIAECFAEALASVFGGGVATVENDVRTAPATAVSQTIVRADDPLPPLVLLRLSTRARNILSTNRIEKTPRGICALDRKDVMGLDGAGKIVADEMMELRARCLDGSVWNDEVGFLVEGELRPDRFASLSEYVLAVAGKTCDLDDASKKILAEHLCLLNNTPEEKKTLDELRAELGGVTRERVRQLEEELTGMLFSDVGKAIFAGFVDCAKRLFSQRGRVVKKGELVEWVNSAYSTWTGTTEFSVVNLLECCGFPIEDNAYGYMAWMADGKIANWYKTYLGLLNDERVPLEKLTTEAIMLNADSLGLEGITEGEFLYLLYRVFANDRHVKGENPSRWDLFLRLRCGLQVNRTEKRRYVVAKALRAAGMKGLTYSELVERCTEIDPTVEFRKEADVKSDADPNLKYDMDGTGVHLIVYDYKTHAYTLDEFFRDEKLLRLLKESGERLRKRMERNGVGVATVTRIVGEINAALPEPYASVGLPSACIYYLMREQGVAGLNYFDHPNVAHPDIIEANGGQPPRKALSWVIYEYFRHVGRETVSGREMRDFCEQILGANTNGYTGAMLKARQADGVAQNGEKMFRLKPPDETISPPQVLLPGGKFDFELRH